MRLLLQEIIQRGASDLHITVGDKPKLRVDGDLVDSNINYVLAPEGHARARVLDSDREPEEALRDRG